MKRNKRKKGRRFLKIGFDFRYKTFIITYESLAKIFYPNKKARKNRVAFMMIYIALRENWRDDTTTAKLEEIRRERAPEISRKTMMDTLNLMDANGLITHKKHLFWLLSDKFGDVLRKLADAIDIYHSYREDDILDMNRRWVEFEINKAELLFYNQNQKESYVSEKIEQHMKIHKLIVRIRNENKKESNLNRKKAKEEMRYRALMSRKALEKNPGL